MHVKYKLKYKLNKWSRKMAGRMNKFTYFTCFIFVSKNLIYKIIPGTENYFSSCRFSQTSSRDRNRFFKDTVAGLFQPFEGNLKLEDIV